MSEELLSIADIDALTGDDIAYWLNNPFVDRDSIAGKVRFWVTKSVAASVAQAATIWSQRANEGLSASVLAAKAEAWDEGVRTALDFAVRNPDGITLRLNYANPYREATP